MGGPAGVSDANRSVERMQINRSLEIDHTAGLLGNGQPVGSDATNTCGVISAILEPLQSADDQRSCLLRANVSYDSAHGRKIRMTATETVVSIVLE